MAYSYLKNEMFVFNSISRIILFQVPDYLDKISHPMDFSLMQNKIDSHCYATIDQFEDDFQLMIDNCLTYNEKGSFFYRIAVKLRREVSELTSVAVRDSTFDWVGRV